MNAFFWHVNVRKNNEIGSQLCQCSYNEPYDLHVFCDAYETGFDGHMTADSEDEPLEVFGTWSETEKVQSSTWRLVVCHVESGSHLRRIDEDRVVDRDVTGNDVTGSREPEMKVDNFPQFIQELL